MKFVIISAALLVCSVSASPFMFNSYQPMMNHFMSKMYPSHQYQQQSAAPTQVQVQPVQYHQAVQYQQAAAPVQYQQAPAQIQYRQAVAPVQYQQVQATPYQQVATPVQVQYQQAAPVQVAPVQFYYQSWPQVRQAPAEPTIIYIQRSKPEERANAGNINVTTHSTSSSVANANNNNVVQTPPPPPSPPAAQSAPVSLQSVVVVHNPAPGLILFDPFTIFSSKYLIFTKSSNFSQWFQPARLKHQQQQAHELLTTLLLHPPQKLLPYQHQPKPQLHSLQAQVR